MLNSHPRLLALALVCSAVAAQGTKVVSPSALANSYGGINNSIPWGPFTSSEQFCQQIDAGLLGTPGVLKAMAFRHQYSVAHVAKSYVLTLRLGDAATGPTGISTTFASNFKVGSTPTTVFNGTLNFPAVGISPRPPAPFDSPILFTVPHVYTGQDPVIWEAYIASSNPVTPTQFYERGPGSTHTAGFLGTGCLVTGAANPMTATGSISNTTVLNTLANGPVSSTATLMFGDTANTVGGIPLPLDLALIGSAGCFLHINPIVFLSFPTTAAGGSSTSFAIVMSPAISGSRLRTQWVALDGAQLKTSNGLDHSVPYSTAGVPWPLGRVYATSFGTTPPATGSIQANGLVTEWTY